MKLSAITTTSAVAITASLIAAGCALATPNITEIELGQAGVAHYTMVQETTGHTLEFTVPQAAASDILASLVVKDPSGAVIEMQTDTPGSVDAALLGTAFETGLPNDLPRLLAKLIGQQITVTDSGIPHAGILVGVNTAISTTAPHPRALIFDGTQVVEVSLSTGVQVQLSTQTSQRLSDALDATQAPSQQRRFDLTLSGSDTRDVTLSYVTEAPAWKNSYRLLLDEGRVQGWATLENTSGHDWKEVELTLTTGFPIAYRTGLIDPKIIARPDLQDLWRDDNVAAQLHSPRANTGLLSMMSNSAAPITASGPNEAFAAVNANGVLRYEMPSAITLDSGRTTNLMYFDAPIQPTLHALYQPISRGEDVLIGVALQPDIGLAPGVFSVQDSRGFVGDAPFSGSIAQQRTLLPVGAAIGAEVVMDQKMIASLNSVTHSGDRLTFQATRQVITTYKTPVPANVQVFTVEHPKSNAELDSTNGEVKPRADYYEISVPVVDGQADLTVTEVENIDFDKNLTASDLARLLTDVKANAAQAPTELITHMTQLQDLLAQRQTNDTEISASSDRYEALLAEQKRLRENIAVEQNSALATRYASEIKKTEDHILDMFKALDRLRAANDRLETQISDVLNAL